MINNIFFALALASAASAAPLAARYDCQGAYKACIAAGTPQVACSCTLAVCLGEDSARNREYCASATASLAQPSKTEIPGGCNPAHPGSCPSSYFTYTQTAPVETFTSIPGIPGGCNPAHPGSCPSSYFTYAKPTATVDKTSTVKATFTPIPGIPGGCNPAHPGSCPSSYFTYPVASSTAAPSAPPAPPAPTGGSGDVTYPSPKLVTGKSWSVVDLVRYCGEDNSGCDYNFAIEADGKTQRCTIIRMPGANAATESWSDQSCTDGSEFKVSWGYVTEPGPAFAVVTVVKGKELAWFGVSNVNDQKVTPSSPFGSGHYGNLGPEPVYTY